jgi:uncharacterized protein YndB with AHSA1/START domain
VAVLEVRQTHVLPAPRERVFAALTEPEQLARWWGPDGFAIPAIDFQPRVGATYRIEMQPPEGDPFHLTGAFREVDPPARLAFTFVWEPATADDRETLAALDLADRDGSTEVHLEQGSFATEERRSLHDSGWAQSIGRLERLLAG